MPCGRLAGLCDWSETEEEKSPTEWPQSDHWDKPDKPGNPEKTDCVGSASNKRYKKSNTSCSTVAFIKTQEATSLPK